MAVNLAQEDVQLGLGLSNVHARERNLLGCQRCEVEKLLLFIND